MTDASTAPAETPGPSAILISEKPPLRELYRYARGHRSRMVVAAVLSAFNKICDVAPELLIGAAVDVVVKRDGGQSFIGRLFGIEDTFGQLTALVILTATIWVFESASEFAAVV
ncbi:MAG: ABC transporter ATP-binding protein, partial [Acidimicrobiales bacterium]|nr:ABC transporter ATP-binding protein [Acidimicrobiales bacterium]